MELELRNGDYVADGVGGLRRVGGREALLQRVLFRLTARRGSFPFWQTLGSRLWELGRVPAPERRSAARQYVAEAETSGGPPCKAFPSRHLHRLSGVDEIRVFNLGIGLR